ncbi:MAG: hypothetical protein JNM51_17370, partial [Bacteroidia bacterium]|nr:hypothetical protein [Bacteroidia bacterium]
LNNIGNVILSKLTFKQVITSNSSFHAQLILITPAAVSSNSLVTINNCQIFPNSYSHRAVFIDAINLYRINFQFKNNYVYGPVGVAITQGINSNSTLIKGNLFYEQSGGSILYTNVPSSEDNNIIEDNIIKSTNLMPKEIFSIIGSTVIIRRNKVDAFKARVMNTGIGSMVKVHNNFFISKDMDSDYVMYLAESSGAEIYNNTIRTNVLNLNYVFYINSKVSLKNNIIENKGNGRMLDCNISALLTASNNKYYSEGNQFGFYQSNPVSSFTNWKSVTSLDQNSFNEPSFFINDSTYKLIGDIDANGTALTFTNITTDIDGNARSITNPDIGAYEFNLVNNDAGITRFVKPMDSVLCSGNNSISVVLRNYGANNLTSVSINYKLNNNIQPSYNWSGNLTSGDSTIVTIGSVNVSGGRKNQFKFYTSNPNGVPDISAINDTLITKGIRTRLSGIYTIGGSSPNYNSLKQAVDSLNCFGVCGPVIYNIRNGIYNSNLTINSIIGSSLINKVTFQSASLDSSLVIITDTLLYLSLNNTRNLAFKSLTFYHYTIYNSPSIEMIGNALNNISVSNCVFKQQMTSTISGSIRIINSTMASGNMTFNNNLFVGNTGISIYNQNTINPHPRGYKIVNNMFPDNGYLKLEALDSVVIANNVFNNISSTSVYNTCQIIGSNRELYVYNNKYRKVGPRFTDCNGPGFEQQFYNNIIDSAYLTITNTPHIKIFHNTISHSSAFSLGVGATPLFIDGILSQQVIKNNILCNNGGGVCIGFRDNTFNGANNPNMFNNNVLYCKSDTVVFTSKPGVYVATKSNWQNLYYQDRNSVFFKPSFAGAHDFHIVNDHNIDNLGESNSIATYDADDILRNASTPDIGAYEFNSTPVNDDAGILNIQNSGSFCANSSSPVTVNLKNYGSNVLNTVKIKWSINGLAQPDYNWSGSLAAGTTSLVSIGNTTLVTGANYILSVNTLLPNGNVDAFGGNDTLKMNIGSPKLNGIYTVGGIGADYGSLSAVVSALDNYGVCGSVTFKFNPGVYSYPMNNISLGNISGNTLQNSITFESANGNNSAVIFDQTNLSFSDVSGLFFKKITFKANILTIGLNTKTVLFENNIFKTSTVSSTKYHENVSFVNNYFSDAPNNFISYNHAFGSQYPKNILIKGNVFYKPTTNAIDILNVDSLVIDSNSFYRSITNVTSNIFAIRIVYPQDHFKISRNKIRGTFETGIVLGTKYGNRIGNPSVENNVVIGSAYTQGCISSSCDSVSILYNTLHLPQTSVAYSALVSGRANTVKNNIISSKGSIPLYIGTLLGTKSDYNVLYTTGTILIKYYNSGVYTTTSLSTYSASTGLEIHSMVANPQYVNDTLDLHYTNHALDGRAIPIASVLIDQQNKLRNALTPNPGAYETAPDTTMDLTNKSLVLKSIQTSSFTSGANNIITASIFYTYPQLTDTNTYKYRGTIDSLRIHYQVNNQPEVIEKWYGTLYLNDSLTYTFTNPFYAPNGKVYKLKVWFENLNTTHHEINFADDSLTKQFSIPMKGDYTIGGNYPDFLSYGAAISSLSAVGSSGNVRFLYRPGTYLTGWGYEQNNSVTYVGSIEFTSETGNPNDVKISLTWLDDVFITPMIFSKLTIVPKYSYESVYGPFDGIKISCVNETTFDSCFFKGGSSYDSRVGLHYQFQSNGISATIKNCTFKNLNFAVYCSSIETYCSTFSTKDFVFENNIVDSCDYGLIIASANYYLSSSKWSRIKNNSIRTYTAGISINPIGGGFGSSVTQGRFEIS